MPITSLDAVPVELTTAEGQPAQPVPTGPTPSPPPLPSDPAKDASDAKIRQYVINWRNQLRNARSDKRNIWDECWQLYRGLEDFTDKEDWQSQLTLPKAWGAVKSATSTIKRLLATARSPWAVESQNPDDLVTALRAEQMTDLTKVFMDQAKYQEEFGEGLECGFIIGLGVWKVWWGLVPRTRTRVETVQVPINPMQPADAGAASASTLLGPAPFDTKTPPFAQPPVAYPTEAAEMYPPQLPNEALNPSGWSPGEAAATIAPQAAFATQRQIVREEILEGRLLIRAVDPYNFYWLPGSKLNRFTGTLEEIEIPRWQLLELVELGVLDAATVAAIRPCAIDESQKKSTLRFSERPDANRGDENTGVVKITEFYGPLVIDGKLIERYAHILIANDNTLLLPGGYQKNQFWHRKAPYIAFSPLALPFRTEGVGLIELDRKIHLALSQLARLSMDTLMFRLLPVFEINVDAFENPEDFDTGLTPGKLFKRNPTYPAEMGIRPIEFQDISGGTTQVAAWLDREHQGASLVSEIQQAMPRYRGVQSASEVQLKSENQDSFFGAMATDIEKQALEPMIEMAVELILQFIDTAADPRVASILGIGADVLRGLTREEKLEMIVGDYKIKASGISGQLQKAEMLQNLVQFMNLIGQNPEAWLPYLNQDALLRRILEAFRPAIHDLEDIIADPETAVAKQAAMSNEQITPDMLRQMVQMIQMSQEVEQQKQQAALQQQQAAMEIAGQQQDMALQERKMQHDEAMADKQTAMQRQAAAAAKTPKLKK